MDADAAGAIVYVGERAVRVGDFVGEGGFAGFAFADDEHFGFVEMVLALGSELVVIVEDVAVALTSNFYRRLLNGVFVKVDAAKSIFLINFDCHSACR